MSKVTSVDLAEWPEFEKEVVKTIADLNEMLPLMRKIAENDSFSTARKEQELGKLVDRYLPA